MPTIVRLLTPHSLGHAIILTIVFAGAVFVFDLLLLVCLADMTASQLRFHGITTGLAATPFIILAIWLLSQHQKKQVQLNVLADTDDLTGLKNRRAFLRDAKMHITSRPTILMLLDVDHFKSINDTYGHLRGDSCLQAIAALIVTVVPEDSLVGRLGGEEFAVLLPKQNVSGVDDLVAQLAAGVPIAGAEGADDVQVTLSVGVCAVTSSQSLDEALHETDRALYAAKAAGRAQGKWTTTPHDEEVSFS